MEKLGQLRAQDAWDLIVVDTPPCRSALDFLDAPKRLGSFLDGKFIRVLMAPAKVGGRAGMKFLNVGMSMMTGALEKLLGAQLLRDVQTFVAAMDTMFGGFRTRADATYKLLQAPGTAFLVVAAPERDALREAAYFVERLAAEDMPLAGLVLNRVHGSGAAQLSAERALAAAENLDERGIVDQGGGNAELRTAPDSRLPRPSKGHARRVRPDAGQNPTQRTRNDHRAQLAGHKHARRRDHRRRTRRPRNHGSHGHRPTHRRAAATARGTHAGARTRTTHARPLRRAPPGGGGRRSRRPARRRARPGGLGASGTGSRPVRTRPELRELYGRLPRCGPPHGSHLSGALRELGPLTPRRRTSRTSRRHRCPRAAGPRRARTPYEPSPAAGATR